MSDEKLQVEEISFQQKSAPSAPRIGSRKLFFNRDGELQVIDDAGEILTFPDSTQLGVDSFGDILTASYASGSHEVDATDYGGVKIRLTAEMATVTITGFTGIPAGRTLLVGLDSGGEVGTVRLESETFAFTGFNLDTRAVLLYTPDGTAWYRVAEAGGDYPSVTTRILSADVGGSGLMVSDSGNFIPINGQETLGETANPFIRAVISRLETNGGAAPTLKPGSADESVSGVSVTGNDMAGTINFDVTNGGETAPGGIFAIRFDTIKATIPLVKLWPSNNAAVDDGLEVIQGIPFTDGTAFSVRCPIGLTGPKSYALSYAVLDTQVATSGGG